MLFPYTLEHAHSILENSFCHSLTTFRLNMNATASSVKSLFQARASIRIITVQGDGDEPLLEATSGRKSL